MQSKGVGHSTVNDMIGTELLRIRLSQILINEEYKVGKFKIPIHLAFGHEAIAVAISQVISPADKLILTHRNMAYNLARSGTVKSIMDEYHLRETGLAKGRLGSMNLINKEKNIIYTSSILGNNFPVSAGIAMAEKIRKTGAITFVLGGDGSMEEGALYESLVMMKRLALNNVVIIENNEWSLGTHISERREHIDLEKLSDAVGIEYYKLKGNHTEEYINTLQKLKQHSLDTSHPICIEVDVKTLGDRRNPPTPEYPEGKYINYHAGPSSTVDIAKHFPVAILKESEEDPIYVLSQEIGNEKIVKLSDKIMNDLKKEIL